MNEIKLDQDLKLNEALDKFTAKMINSAINGINEAVANERKRRLSEFTTEELVTELCRNRNIGEVKKLLDEKGIAIILK